MRKYDYTAELGYHRAGDTISYSVTEVFPEDITEIHAGCSCQVQEWNLMDTKDGNKIYRIDGSISTPIIIKTKDDAKSKELFKQLRVSFRNSPDMYIKLVYTLEKNENQPQTPVIDEVKQTKATINQISTKSRQYVRVVTRPTSQRKDS
jgi:hypothetical protein